jgi:glucokinase
MALLVADVGGTYTRIAVLEKGRKKLFHKFENRAYPSLSSLLHDFRARHNIKITTAAVAVAGPVRDGETVMPNLAWHVSVPLIKHALLARKAILMNDAAAAAHAIDSAPVTVIKKGRPASNVRALIGPGTGLGAALNIDGKIIATEAGHADFAATTSFGKELYEHISLRHAHVSAERVLSASGIVEIYRMLQEKRAAIENLAEREAIEASSQKAKAVVDAGIAGTDGVAEAALKEYCALLGAFAGSYALATGASGGVYIFGSIANRLAPMLRQPDFSAAFVRKGRMRSWCEKVPVFVITDTDVVLDGAALAAHKPFKQGA